MQEDKRDVVFIDAYNLIYRAFHGNMAKLTSLDGTPTNALFTVVGMIEKLPKKFNDLAYCLVVFDGSSVNFREELDENYKKNRKPMPDELKVQMPYIREAFEILGWPMMDADGVEADDVIGTLAVKSARAGFNTYIVSGDKDFRQIVKDNINVMDTMHDVLYDADKIMEKMEIGVDNVVSYLALLGDSIDNVKGIDKVGKKTAVKWLSQYGNMENLCNCRDELVGTVAGRNFKVAVEDGTIAKNIELITLKTDLDIVVKSRDVTKKEIDVERWADFCHKMNLKSYLKFIRQGP